MTNPESTSRNPESGIPQQDIQKDTQTCSASNPQLDTDTLVKETRIIQGTPCTGDQDTDKHPETTEKCITSNETREQIKRKLHEGQQKVNDDNDQPPHKSAKVIDKTKNAEDLLAKLSQESLKMAEAQERLKKAQERLKKAREATRVKYGIGKKKHSPPKVAKSKAEMAAILNTSLEKGKNNQKDKDKIISKEKEKVGTKDKSYKDTTGVFMKSRPWPGHGIPQGWYLQESYKTKNQSSPEFKTSPDMNSTVMHSRNGQYYLDLTDREIQKKLVSWMGILAIQNKVSSCFICRL